MQLVVLSATAPPQDLTLGPVQPDESDATTLAWLDLDRSEAHELPRLVPAIPIPLARELVDASTTPELRRRDGLIWVSMLSVSDAVGGSDLADLDILMAPGLLVTVHRGPRPALVRLRDPGTWRRRLAPPLSRAALELVIDATLDAYDDLIDEAEEEVGRLHTSAATVGQRDVAARLRLGRRRMMAIQGRLAAQRTVFAELGGTAGSTSVDGPWWIGDRLEAAIAAAREVADYALAGSWSLHETSRTRRRELGLVLLAAWTTFLGVLVITRLAVIVGVSAIDPLWLVGGLLAVLTLLVVGATAARRWL